ncbi:MAG: TIGR02221 family CRISPR-associated protein [Candidatus Lokiarchaeota archaeon]|nr:TIGR02221 family CRISPR-associated protein [Candidatus Harpocratesius repetitus]
MAKVFLTFLGTNNYLPANYSIGTVTANNIRYVQIATIKYLCSEKSFSSKDRLVFFLTEEAKKKNWEDNGHRDKNGHAIISKGLKSCLQEAELPISVKNIKTVRIPIGKSEDELYDIFNKILDEIHTNDEIFFDITHAFRSLPLITIIFLVYAYNVKSISLGGLYYGAFDTLGPISEVKKKDVKDRNVPIFDMTPFYDLLDWSIAINNFSRFGRAEKLEVLNRREIARRIIKADKLEKSNLGNINSLIARIKSFLLNIRTCRGLSICGFNPNGILEELNNFQTFLIEPMKPLMKLFQENFSPFLWATYFPSIKKANNDGIQSNIKPDLKISTISNKQLLLNQLGVLQWCVEHDLIQQAVTFMREFVLNYLLKSLELSIDLFLQENKNNDESKSNSIKKGESGINLYLKIQEMKEYFAKKNKYELQENISRLITNLYNPQKRSLNLQERSLNPQIFENNQFNDESFPIEIKACFNLFSVNIYQILYDLRDLRNDLNHAGFRNQPRKAKAIQKQVKINIDKWKQYLIHQKFEYYKILFSPDLFLHKEEEKRSKQIALLFSHHLLEHQKVELFKDFGIEKFIIPPSIIKSKWSSIPPDLVSITDYLAEIKKWLKDTLNRGDFVLIQGDFGATIHMVNYCKRCDFISIYATTERKKTKTIKDDGSIHMTQEFRHVRFRKYELD